MNYFELHLGDYEAATAHLTAIEDGMYGRLLRLYYRTEKPLPADLKQVYRLARAQSKVERDAVDQVLADFFELRDDGWHQERCDSEIERYQAGEPEREIKKANEGNRLKRHREERATLFKVITDAGLHAPWNMQMKELREMAQRCRSRRPETQPATAPATPATATQTPDTRHQTPEEDTYTEDCGGEGGARTRDPDPQPTRPGDPRFAMHAEWRPSQHLPGLAKFAGLGAMGAEAVEKGMGEFVAYWLTQPDTLRTQPEWDHALIRSLRHDRVRAESAQAAGQGAPRPAPVNRQQALEDRNRAVADEWLRDMEARDATQ